MRMRWGPGPVFAFESRIAARRWQMYALRALVVGVLLGALTIVWDSEMRNHILVAQGQLLSYKDYSRLGQAFFHAVIGTQKVSGLRPRETWLPRPVVRLISSGMAAAVPTTAAQRRHVLGMKMP